MKIGVTGANGLLGRSIVGALQQLPKMEIRALVRQLPRVEGHPRTDWLLGDLARPEDCRAFVADLDVVLHCAHKNSPLTSDGDWAQDARLNLIPTLNLLGAIEGAKRCPHLIYPSSGGAVYGLSRACAPFRESDPCLPENSYGIQKLAVERYLRVFAERELLTATVLRIGNAYGWLLAPDRSQGFIGTAINRVLHGQPVRLIGDPHNVRDYVYVDDILSAVLKVLEGRRGFEIFNIGSGVGASVMDILALIERKIGEPPLVHVETVVGAYRLPPWCVLDITAANQQLGWHPHVSLEEGIVRMLDTAASSSASSQPVHRSADSDVLCPVRR